jgi:tetratricopeptide (TPR) repeat protein
MLFGLGFSTREVDMKSRFLAFSVLILVAATLVPVATADATASAPDVALAAKTAADYVSEAQALAQGGKLADAIALLQQGAKDYPESSDIYAYLGLYTGQSAGQAASLVDAGRLTTEAFALLDKAVELGPDNPTAYFYRGIMGVRVPVFLAKLPGGITDLKKVIALHDKSPDAVPQAMFIAAYASLAEGYEKGSNPTDARAAYEMVVKLAPGTDAAKNAQAKLASLAPAAPKAKPAAFGPKAGDPADIAALKKRIEAEPSNAALELDLARALMAAQRFEEAREVLHHYNDINPSNAEAYQLLFQVVGALANVGYDPKIAEDTNYRTNLAFEAMNAADKAVQLDPNNVESRLARGITGVSMPFFVGKFDQGVADLEYVLKNTTSPADSAQAMYWLGAARERQAMRFWLNVATKYPDTDAARMAMAGMRPIEPSFDAAKAAKPIVTIDFVSGFRDELAPQIAIWIEDASEKHVKTVYVSGFAGNVKGKQVTLPVWAATSNFAGADAVTGASIDVGHYIYTWDCKDLDGKLVKPGKYTAKVEVMHWPSMKYQLAEAAFTIGKKEESVRVEEGDCIPSLVVTYYPK